MENFGGDEQELESVRKVIRENFKKIGDCDDFVSLFTMSYEKEPYCLMQLAIGIALNKPIFLLIEEGIMPSPKIMKVCDGWEMFDKASEESLKGATLRLMAKAKEFENKKGGGAK